MSQATPATRQLPPRFIYQVINPLFAFVLRTPLHGLLSRRLTVLAFNGRKSGKRYRIPVGYVATDRTILVTTASRWWKNLRDGAPVEVWLQGRPCRGATEIITDEAEIAASYRVLLAAAPELGQFIGVTLDADGQPDRAAVARARQNGYVVIRVRLD